MKLFNKGYAVGNIAKQHNRLKAHKNLQEGIDDKPKEINNKRLENLKFITSKGALNVFKIFQRYNFKFGKTF